MLEELNTYTTMFVWPVWNYCEFLRKQRKKALSLLDLSVLPHEVNWKHFINVIFTGEVLLSTVCPNGHDITGHSMWRKEPELNAIIQTGDKKVDICP